MKNRTSSRTGLFLMELILAVLLFALASVLCIQMFVKSHTLSKSSVELNHGVLWAQNVSEAFYGCNGNIEEMSLLFPEGICETTDGNSHRLLLYFDENFTPVAISSDIPEEKAFCYQLSAVITPEGEDLLRCRITVSKASSAENIYALDLSLFLEKEVSHEP